MPFYKDHIYPDLVDVPGDPMPVQKIRQQIIPEAQVPVRIFADSILQKLTSYTRLNPTRE